MRERGWSGADEFIFSSSHSQKRFSPVNFTTSNFLVFEFLLRRAYVGSDNCAKASRHILTQHYTRAAESGMAGLGTTDVAIDVRTSTVEASGASKLMESISLVANTQRAAEKFKAMNQGVPLEALKPIEAVTRAPLPATLEHNTIFHEAADPNTLFKAGDIVLSRKYNRGDHLLPAMVMAPLATIFKEADADGDGKLTYAEWTARFGHLAGEKELRELRNQ